jgi:cytidine deaminase
MDEELIDIARRLIERRADGEHHTVAAAARAANGRTVQAVNVYHFTGGPCAELVVIGLAASEGCNRLSCIVAVRSRDLGVIAPCGRCRQVLSEYHPWIEVIVPVGGSEVRQVPISDLLPYQFVG